jgi:hypothetical protein
MYIQRIGILSQTQGVAAARPSNAVYLNANSLSYADYSKYFKQDTFSICGWIKAPDNTIAATLCGHDDEFTYTFAYNPPSPYQFGTTVYDSNTTDMFGANAYFYENHNQQWLFFGISRNKATGLVFRKVYTTSTLINAYTGSTNTNGMRDGGTPVNFYVGCGRGRGVQATYRSHINALGYWNRALTPSEIIAVWNGGAGLSYANLTSGQKTNLTAWYDCDALNGSNGINDKHTNGYNLTKYNTNISIVSV